MFRTTLLTCTIFASPAFAIDDCLVGIWDADGTDMALVLGVQMGGSATHSGGRTSLEVTSTGAMTLRAEDMTFSIQVPNIPAIDVTVIGYAQGAIDADDGATYVATAPDYALVGAADVLGERMEIPVNAGGGAGWGTSTGTYSCDGNSLTFEATQLGSIPRSWRRIR